MELHRILNPTVQRVTGSPEEDEDRQAPPKIQQATQPPTSLC